MFIYFVVIFNRKSSTLSKKVTRTALADSQACPFCETIIDHLHFYVQNISHSCRNTGNTCCFQVPEGILKKDISKPHFTAKIAWI